MPEEERLRLRAIGDRVSLVRGWAEEMDEAAFLVDPLTRDAVAMSLLVIGETARRLGDETKARAPEIPWPAIHSLRNRIAHGYETVDHRLVWQIVSDDLPLLAAAVDRLLAEEV
ncbi:MAG: HepT-like ribonuclease domain-containing protein [Caulobacteraceae bacterium]